jgi:Fic family protein
MNETIKLEPRQKAILNLLAQNAQLSREQIAERLVSVYPVSKATLARDLSLLISKNFIIALGKGPSSCYKTKFEHPLVKPVDLAQYFAFDPDQRKEAKVSFEFEIFNKLTGNLIFPEEKDRIATLFRSFNETIDTLDTTLRQRELERFMIELSWKSSKIEGNTYSLLETEALIKQSQEAAGKTKQEATMILNHKDAFRIIVENRNAFKTLSMTSIMELHNTLTKGLSITSGIRKQAVGITGTTYKPLDNEWQIKDALEKLIQTVNTVNYPLEKALIITSMLSYIQPFTDGNKRTSRMLSNAILLGYDYFPLSYRSVDENEYKEALILFYETNNLYYIKRLFLEQYRFAVKTYFL